MFALNPGGKGGSGGHSQLRQNLWFFGKLGLYFGAIRLAFILINKDDKSNKITQN
jgi:hypothetical protein